MGGNTDGDGIKAGGRKIGDRAAGGLRRQLGQHQSQRTRPEGFRERGRPGVEAGEPPGGCEIADMGDQRVEGGAAFGLIEPGDRRRIGRIRAEPIDGFGRKCDQTAPGEAPRGRLGRARLCESQGPRCQAEVHRGVHWVNFPKLGFLQCAKPKAISRPLKSECGSAR